MAPHSPLEEGRRWGLSRHLHPHNRRGKATHIEINVRLVGGLEIWEKEKVRQRQCVSVAEI